jgi:hypothetical protein
MDAALAGVGVIGGNGGVIVIGSLYFIAGSCLTILLQIWRYEFIDVTGGSFAGNNTFPNSFEDENSGTYQSTK